MRLQGELFGDPDFCTFRVTGGTDFGLPSPGHTTLTDLGKYGQHIGAALAADTGSDNPATLAQLIESLPLASLAVNQQQADIQNGISLPSPASWPCAPPSPSSAAR